MPTTHRNSCVETAGTSASSPGLQACGIAQRQRRLRFGWRIHGALNFPIDPIAEPMTAPAIWQAEDCALVVTITGSINEWARIVEDMVGDHVICDRTGPLGRHLVLDHDGLRHRLLLKPGGEGIVPSYILPVEGHFAVRQAVLMAFHRRAEGSRSPARAGAAQPTPFQHHRLRLMLAALDARRSADGSRASVRQIASDLSGGDSFGERAIEWKTSSMRRHIQRLVAGGLQLVQGGYRDLLNARSPGNGRHDSP